MVGIADAPYQPNAPASVRDEDPRGRFGLVCDLLPRRGNKPWMPEWLAIREVRVRVADKTKRARRPVIATTLTDARTYQIGSISDESDSGTRSGPSFTPVGTFAEFVKHDVAFFHHILAYILTPGIIKP